jgi:hypothetical protein
MKKTTNVFVVISLIAIANLRVSAQENDSIYANKVVQKSPRRFEYYFNGAFGFYFPTNAGNLDSRGGINSVQFQVNYRDNFFSRLSFDLYNVGYTDNVNLNGINTFVQDKMQTTYIGLDLGYTGGIGKKLAWFAYGGVGLASMDVPLKEYNPATNTLRITTSTRNFLSYRGGAGFEYEFSRFFVVYIDAQYLSIQFKTDLSNQQLNGYSLQIGFKTPLQ